MAQPLSHKLAATGVVLTVAGMVGMSYAAVPVWC